MPFAMRNRKKGHVDPPVVEIGKSLEGMKKEQEVFTQQEIGSVEEVLGQSVADPMTSSATDHTALQDYTALTATSVTEGQSVADPTAELIQGSSSETVSTPTVEETVSVTELPVPSIGDTTTPELVESGGEQEVIPPVLIETCEASVVGPPEAVAAASTPGTALAVVKQGDGAVVKKPVISARMLKTWGRSVKDSERKANLLLPGVSPDFPPEMVITVVVGTNPKLPGKGPWLRFAKYRSGMTVGEYVKACERVSPSVKVSHADLKWDVNHGYIRVTVAEEAGAPKVVEKAA